MRSARIRSAHGPAVVLAAAFALAGAANGEAPRGAAAAGTLAEQLVATAEQRSGAGDKPAALRAYQRALFWLRGPLGAADASEPAPAWLSKIVPLASELGRDEEAIRYALLLPPDACNNPKRLRELSLHAREQSDWAAAARLQERWLAARRPSANRFEAIMGSLELGRLHYLADNTAAASRAFGVVQDALLNPGTPADTRSRVKAALGGSLEATWELFGQTHFEAERTPTAAQAFAQLATQNGGSPRAAYLLAQIALADRRPLVAYDLLKRSLQDRGGELEAAPYELLVDVYRRLNQPGLAVDELRRLSDRRPRNANIPLVLGLLLADSGKDDEAEALLASAMQRFVAAENADPLFAPPDADAPPTSYRVAAEAGRWLLDRYASTRRRAALLRLAGQVHAAFGSLDEFTTPIKSALSTDDRLSAEIAQRLTRPSADGALAPDACAELAAIAGLGDEAAEALFKAAASAASNDERQTQTLLGWQTLTLHDQHTAAAELLRRALDKAFWPGDAHEPHHFRALSLMLADEPADALAAARLAAERAPNDLGVLERLGWTLTENDMGDEAIGRYKKTLADFDSQTDAGARETLRGARLSLSFLLDERGDTDSAAELALQVLDEFPDNAGALNDLAYLWAKTGRHATHARRMAERAVALEPDNFAYHDTLAWVRFRLLADPAAALASVERALDLLASTDRPDDGEVLEHLGDILAALDRPDDARNAWRRSVAAFDEAGEADRAAAVRKKATPAAKDDPAADAPASNADAARL